MDTNTSLNENTNHKMLIDDSIGRRILQSAMQIIDEEGYESLTIRKVAKVSGCSNTAIYMRFADKTALTIAIAALYAKPFIVVMDDNYIEGDTFINNMNRITTAALEKVFELDDAMVQLQMFYRAKTNTQENPFVMRIVSYTNKAVARGEIFVPDVEVFAYSVMSNFWGLAFMLKCNPDTCDNLAKAKDILAIHSSMIWRGISMENNKDMFWDTLKGLGVDVDKALERMKGNKEAYKEFLIEFFEDYDFEELDKAIEAQDPKAAFDCAHGLKGMAANLGLDTIHKELSTLVEILRPGGIIGAREAYDRAMLECDKIKKLVSVDLTH